MKYGAMPHLVGYRDVDCTEFMFYQYLPVKFPGFHEVTLEPRLEPFSYVIGAACCDYIGLRGLDAYVAAHVYVTAKRLFLPPYANMNRPGWHSDGFLTDDINYIWSDCLPTVFNGSDFRLTLDDEVSLGEMALQALPANDAQFEPNTVLRLDQFVIHRPAVVTEPTTRTFCKVSISGDQYDLEGNSHNYRLSYNWPMRKRGLSRNVPQRLSGGSGDSRNG